MQIFFSEMCLRETELDTQNIWKKNVSSYEKKESKMFKITLIYTSLFRAYIYRITEVIDSIQNNRKTEWINDKKAEFREAWFVNSLCSLI